MHSYSAKEWKRERERLSLIRNQFIRHHNVIVNKTLKHNGQLEKIPLYYTESNQQKNAAASSSVKHHALNNIPLYHAYYHQHNHNDSSFDSFRMRSSIRKRAPNDEKQISTNITMVLEDLLK